MWSAKGIQGLPRVTTHKGRKKNCCITKQMHLIWNAISNISGADNSQSPQKCIIPHCVLVSCSPYWEDLKELIGLRQLTLNCQLLSVNYTDQINFKLFNAWQRYLQSIINGCQLRGTWTYPNKSTVSIYWRKRQLIRQVN